MKSFSLFLFASLFIAAWLLFSTQDEIKEMQADFQAYQTRALLPESYKEIGR